MDQGDDTKMRSFYNSQLGLPYAYKSDMPEPDVLKERAEDYQEFTVTEVGCVLTAGVEVQHDRLAIAIRAWGQGEESWLVYWGEIRGQTIVPEKGSWLDLDALLKREFKVSNGASVFIRAVSIDSSDGQTSVAVYTFVRKRLARGYMAIKGSSDNTSAREIFTSPKFLVDLDAKQKAFKYGLRPFIVGTSRAKDLILGVDSNAGRIKLEGRGPGRMHWYKEVRSDYWEQITSEVKVPTANKQKRVWQKKSGVRNEALDCEVYVLHAARSLKLNLWSPNRWAAERERQLQIDSIELPQTETVLVEQTHKEVKPEKIKGRDNFFDVLKRRKSLW